MSSNSEDSSRVVVIPLVLASVVTDKDSTLNPQFEVEAACVSLFPLDISSMNKKLLAETVATLRSDGDRIVAALDLLFARF